MKRLLALGIVLVILVFSGLAVRHTIWAEARKMRESGYEADLQKYSKRLRPGLTRAKVETYLRSNAIKFGQMGGFGLEEPSTFADLVKVGKEDTPWYCSENDVNIAFEFAATEPHEPLVPYDSDVLKTVRIFRHLGGCL